MSEGERKFLVRIAGQHCRVRIDGTDGRPRTTSGFFATRFVLAPGPAEAGRTALDLVLSELSQLAVDRRAPPELTIDDVREDPGAYDAYAPGRGFTWF